MIDNISIYTLIAAAFFLIAAIISIRSLRLPKSFFDNIKKRNEIKEQKFEEEIQEEMLREDIEKNDENNESEEKTSDN